MLMFPQSSIQLAKIRLGAACGSDHKLFMAKSRLKEKKVGNTSRWFRYDLNKIPYDYTMEMTNGFKGWDLIDRKPEELCTEVCDIVQEAVINTIPKKKKHKKAKWSVFIPISKKGNARECSNNCTIALISHTNKNPQNSPSQASTVHEPWTSRCSSWI